MDEAQLYSHFRKKKLRMTSGRRGLIQVLSASPVPLSAPEILHRLRRVGVRVDKTTVYRELERWEKLGLIEKFRLADSEISYELKREHHHHLVCLNCEKVENVTLDEKKLKMEEARARDEKNFLTLNHSLEFFGLCRTCN